MRVELTKPVDYKSTALPIELLQQICYSFWVNRVNQD